MLEHGHCIQYGDFWQVFLGFHGVDVPVCTFARYLAFNYRITLDPQAMFTEVVFGGKKVRSMAVKLGGQGNYQQ